MKSCSAVLVSIVLAVFAAETTAENSFYDQNTCDTVYNLHKNLTTVVTNPVGIQILNEFRQNVKDTCMDPKAHDALVGLIDIVIDVSTDPNVSQSIGKVFYWTRNVVKNENSPVVWHETMNGINMLFDNHKAVRRLTNTVFKNLNNLLNSPYFDTEFEKLVDRLSSMANTRKRFLLDVDSLLSSPAKKSYSSRANRR